MLGAWSIMMHTLVKRAVFLEQMRWTDCGHGQLLGMCMRGEVDIIQKTQCTASVSCMTFDAQETDQQGLWCIASAMQTWSLAALSLRSCGAASGPVAGESACHQSEQQVVRSLLQLERQSS